MKVYNGYIIEDSYGFLGLSEEDSPNIDELRNSLAEKLQNDWKNGQMISVRYYVSPKPITLEEATHALVAKTFGGNLDVSYELEAYSEWTVLEWAEGCQVGGHNLIEELRNHMGKYIVLVIE